MSGAVGGGFGCGLLPGHIGETFVPDRLFGLGGGFLPLLQGGGALLDLLLQYLQILQLPLGLLQGLPVGDGMGGPLRLQLVQLPPGGLELFLRLGVAVGQLLQGDGPVGLQLTGQLLLIPDQSSLLPLQLGGLGGDRP